MLADQMDEILIVRQSVGPFSWPHWPPNRRFVTALGVAEGSTVDATSSHLRQFETTRAEDDLSKDTTS